MKKGTVDLAALDTVKGANEGFDVPILHPATGERLGITINVLGRDSDEFKKIGNAQNKKRIAKMTKGGFRGGGPPTEEIEADGLVLLASCTKGWAGVIIEGKEIPFTTDNAIMVYQRFPWIREQVDMAIGDRANFIKG